MNLTKRSKNLWISSNNCNVISVINRIVLWMNEHPLCLCSFLSSEKGDCESCLMCYTLNGLAIQSQYVLMVNYCFKHTRALFVAFNSYEIDTMKGNWPSDTGYALRRSEVENSMEKHSKAHLMKNVPFERCELYWMTNNWCGIAFID